MPFLGKLNSQQASLTYVSAFVTWLACLYGFRGSSLSLLGPMAWSTVATNFSSLVFSMLHYV